MADGVFVDHRRRTVAEHAGGDWYGRTMDGELEIIRRIAACVGVRSGVDVGIGDDAAVLDDGTVVSLDMVVDGVHVRRSTHSPGDIGHSALAVNISDIAAMGARPVAAFVGLGLPPDFGADDVDAMYRAMESLAADHGMSVAGGDVAASPVLTVSVAIVGRMPGASRPVLRSGGRVGDRLVVTGPLGASAAGLLLLTDPLLAPGLSAYDDLVATHRRPTPRARDGLRLAAAGATAMIDISDGLLLDADRLARASGLRAEVDFESIPLAPGVEDVAVAADQNAIVLAATGGQDYHLLAALPPSAPILDGLTVVGRLVKGDPGVVALRDGRDATPSRLGWEHRTDPPD
ncbi:MAG: thiamine-phosphate kinase [Thermoleophilia bacterium]|nr:thiamine-phosphate kinase [Thermoleophilia bacterium]